MPKSIPTEALVLGRGLDNFIKHQSDVVPSSRRLGYRNGGRTTGECLTPANIILPSWATGKDSVFVLNPLAVYSALASRISF